MNGRFTLTGLLLAALCCHAASAADYYVATNGKDTDAGTINAPWRTIAKANKTLRAGDTVFIRAGEYKEAINPGASGKPGAPIRYEAYAGERVVLTSPPIDAQGKKTAIRIDGRSYIVVDGLKVDGKRLSMSGVEAEVDSFIRFQNAHHNEIVNCEFQYANGYAGVHIHGGSKYNRFISNSFDAVGTNHIPDGYDNAGNDRGDIFVIKEASFNLVENNHFSRGGHNTLDVVGSFNVVRGNTFDGRWTGTASPGSRAAGELSGNVKYGVPEPRGFNLFEFNVVKNASASSDNPNNPAMKVQGYNQIVRGNFFHDNVGAAMLGATREGKIERVQSNRIYNNTLYNTKSLFEYNDYGFDFPFSDNVWKNNLVAGQSSATQVSISFSALADAYTGYAREIDGTTIAGNVFDSADGSTKQFLIKVDGIVLSGDYAWMEDRYPTFMYSNRTAKIAFQDANSRSPQGFTVPSGSPVIDAGVPLTRTTASGSGRTVRVQDARYFYDGFGIPGESGDVIVVGDAQPVRIVSVDYDDGEITLAQSISWSKGAPVNLSFDGGGPDVGAHEIYAGYDVRSNLPRPMPPRLRVSSN